MGRNDSLIKVDNLEVSYGHVNALKGVSLEIKSGEIVVLIGSNGAGKTTIMETILGVNQPRGGRIFYKGKNITQTSVDKIVRSGIFLVPEGRGVFASMSVIDTVHVASAPGAISCTGYSAGDNDRALSLQLPLRIAIGTSTCPPA